MVSRFKDSPGVYGMTITPFDEEGAIDEGLMREHLRYLAAGGVGVYVGSAGTGEGPLLSPEELFRTYELGVQELKGKTPVYAAGLGLTGTRHIIDAAKQAASIGVDGVYIYGPKRLPAGPPTHAEIEGFFTEVLDAVKTPVILANNISVNFYEIPLDIMTMLVGRYDQVIAVASAHMDFAYNDRLLDAIAAKVPVDMSITGHWLDSMERGGRGLLSPDPNVAPRLSRAVFTAFQSGDKKGAAEAFERLKTLSAVLGKHHNPKSQKAALSILGRNGGYLRKPYLPIDDAARKEIAAVLDQLEVRKTEGLE